MPHEGRSMVLSQSELLAKSQVIAIVGMSTQPEKVAHTVPLQLIRHGWTVIPVHPRAESIAGQKAYPQLADAPAAVDLVNVSRPSDQAAPADLAALAVGAPAA